PRLADLFEALLVIRAPAHAIQVLRNDRMIGLGQRKPIDWLISVVTRICSYRQTHLCRVVSHLIHIFDLSNNNIRSGHKVWHSGTDCMWYRWHDHRFRFTPNKTIVLYRSHRGAD